MPTVTSILLRRSTKHRGVGKGARHFSRYMPGSDSDGALFTSTVHRGFSSRTSDLSSRSNNMHEVNSVGNNMINEKTLAIN